MSVLYRFAVSEADSQQPDTECLYPPVMLSYLVTQESTCGLPGMYQFEEQRQIIEGVGYLLTYLSHESAFYTRSTWTNPSWTEL